MKIILSDYKLDVIAVKDKEAVLKAAELFAKIDLKVFGSDESKSRFIANGDDVKNNFLMADYHENGYDFRIQSHFITNGISLEEMEVIINDLVKKNIVKTPYEWCLEANVRVLDLNEWPLKWFGSREKHFFEFPTMPQHEFLEALGKCKVKPNSQPRKTEMYLEYRMYGLVPYNISDKQKGIQFGHAVVRYGRTLRKNPELSHMLDIYDKYADRDETFIILDGGTTNKSLTYVGTMNKHLQLLRDNGILVQDFYEPDLGDQLSAMCFLVDERVFNKTLYPDFVPEVLPWSRHKPSLKVLEPLNQRNELNYAHWVDKIGGPKNAFLREFLKPMRLA